MSGTPPAPPKEMHEMFERSLLSSQMTCDFGFINSKSTLSTDSHTKPLDSVQAAVKVAGRFLIPTKW